MAETMIKHGAERAEAIMAMIKRAHEAGAYVVAYTQAVSIKITAKHVEDGVVRLSKSGEDVVVQRGKRTESLNYCTFKAFMES